MLRISIKKFGIFLIIVALTIIIVRARLTYIENNEILVFESIKTEADILEYGDIGQERRGGRYKITYYYRYITYQYKDAADSIHYGRNKLYSMYKIDMEISKIGDKIDISYSNNDPNKSTIGTPEFLFLPNGLASFMFFVFEIGLFIVGVYFFFQNKYKYYQFGEDSTFAFINETEFNIILLLILSMGIIFIANIYIDIILLIILLTLIVYKLLKSIFISKKRKNINLKVTKIDSIDYEREIVFFRDNENNIYFYETDFGEDFKKDEEYTIELKLKNLKKQFIDFEGEKLKVFEITKINKNEFIKK